ncbi:MAG TPA: glycosyltransferase family 4 protein [Solirubrobacterales bacterium]|jgi:glycosyltransferase involved in cell wall biosynthesis|nr:glycosyltransferase family 4 protein [Solirubrobacterales bacterium]
MPRIAHVISTPEGVGGAERVLASLVAEGAKRGWDQAVLNPFALDPDRSELVGALDGAAPYRGRRCASFGHLPAMLAWLRRELRGFRPDVVHAHLFHAGVAVAALGARRRSGPSRVLTHHHGDHLLFERRRLEARLDRAACRRPDRVVAVSSWGMELLASRLGLPRERLACIPNGWSGTPFPQSGLAGRPTAICVARFRRQKGHRDLLAAFSLVRERIGDARLLLVGDGPLEGEIRAGAAALGLGESVEFRGAVGDVWPHLAEAHVFALASLYEPLGIAALEAMAAGLPVVATAVGGVPELVEVGKTGRLVRPGAPEEMAAALVELLTDPDLRQGMGNEARRRAAGRRASVTVERYFDLYGELPAASG